jgi:hypothetical protein
MRPEKAGGWTQKTELSNSDLFQKYKNAFNFGAGRFTNPVSG